MASRRTQPLRASGKRKQGAALSAAQRGAPAYLQTAHMKRRAATRKRRRRSRRRRKDPLDVILRVRRRA